MCWSKLFYNYLNNTTHHQALRPWHIRFIVISLFPNKLSHWCHDCHGVPLTVFSSIALSCYTAVFLKLISYKQVNKWCRLDAAPSQRPSRLRQRSVSAAGKGKLLFLHITKFSPSSFLIPYWSIPLFLCYFYLSVFSLLCPRVLATINASLDLFLILPVVCPSFNSQYCTFIFPKSMISFVFCCALVP